MAIGWRSKGWPVAPHLPVEQASCLLASIGSLMCATAH